MSEENNPLASEEEQRIAEQKRIDDEKKAAEEKQVADAAAAANAGNTLGAVSSTSALGAYVLPSDSIPSTDPTSPSAPLAPSDPLAPAAPAATSEGAISTSTPSAEASQSSNQPQIASVVANWKDKTAGPTFSDPSTMNLTAGGGDLTAPAPVVRVDDDVDVQTSPPGADAERVPIEASLASGWNHTIKNIWLLFFVSTIAGALLMVPFGVKLIIKDIVDHNFFLQACLFFYSIIIPMLYHMGRLKVTLRLMRSEVFQSDDFVQVAPLIFHYFAMLFCRTIAICVGYLFFIVPGVILQVRLDYADYFIIDKRQNAIDAMKNSWDITKNSVLMLLLFGLTCGFIESLGYIALLIGCVPARWMTGVAKAYVYERLCATAPREGVAQNAVAGV